MKDFINKLRIILSSFQRKEAGQPVNYTFLLIPGLILSIALFFTGCIPVAPTVSPSTESIVIPGADEGIQYPQIQIVSPGTLQSLDVPETITQDISVDEPGIVVVFSRVMEDDNNEMDSVFKLYQESTEIAFDSFGLGSSKYFVIVPSILPTPLEENTEYTLRIYNTAMTDRNTPINSEFVARSSNIATITATAHGFTTGDSVYISGFTGAHSGYNTSELTEITVLDVDNFTYSNSGSNEGTSADVNGRIYTEEPRTLKFNNLVELPATSLNPPDPDYVEYTFMTGIADTGDITPPIILSTYPADGEINVPSNPTSIQIEVVFFDNRIPMVDPTTVEGIGYVTLIKTIDSSAVVLNMSLDTGDEEWKTYRSAAVTLDASSEYKLTISDGSLIEDFAGNAVVQTEVTFITQ